MIKLILVVAASVFLAHGLRWISEKVFKDGWDNDWDRWAR